MTEQNPAPKVRRFAGTPAQIRTAATFYKVLAYATGVMLLLLCAEMLIKYVWQLELFIGGTLLDGSSNSLGFVNRADITEGINVSLAILIIHGWMYVIYLLADFRLWSVMRWPFSRFITIALGGVVPPGVGEVVDGVSASGGTPLVLAEDGPAGARVLGVVHLKDVVKDGMRERFAELRRMGIRTVMITGDNERTARAIAAKAGIDDVLAEATPEDKLAYIRKEQEGGRLVAMTGDGTNDAPALAQADVGVAMNSGTSAAKEAGNMVDLDSDPSKLIDIVRIGKQLLITRGALTTFSLANDVAKYFAIIPAMFLGVFPQLAALNVMGLHSPASAVLSAVVFNAIVIVFLIPLALRGVSYRPGGASAVLGRNLAVYGLGGVVTPFVGIWLIDQVVRHIPGF